MPCRICIEIDSALRTARTPASPELLIGLTVAGERNRTQQKQEKLTQLEMLLKKHRLVCRGDLELSTAEIAPDNG